MTEFRVLSYNVRCANRGDHHDAWHDRRDAVGRLVRFHHPDITAFQEPLPEQRSDIAARLPGYAFVGRGRTVEGDGEGCPIGVRTDRWAVAEHDTFWLSETPDEPSTDWDAAHPRIATWARVVPQSDETDERSRSEQPDILVVNTHLDHVSARARRESARLLRERLPELAPATVGRSNAPHRTVFVGDLNCTPGSKPHQILLGATATGTAPERQNKGEKTASDHPWTLQDAAATADLRHGPNTSLTDFARLIDGRRIDHILVSPDVDVAAFATLADRDDRGRYPSDHLPVLAQLSV